MEMYAVWLFMHRKHILSSTCLYSQSLWALVYMLSTDTSFQGMVISETVKWIHTHNSFTTNMAVWRDQKAVSIIVPFSELVIENGWCFIGFFFFFLADLVNDFMMHQLSTAMKTKLSSEGF